MSEATPPKSNNGSGEMLWEFWYPALRSDQVRGRKLEPRNAAGSAASSSGATRRAKHLALRDVCPHRAFPLSFGQFDGASVECAYHGWQFDAHTGQCRTIPSLTADSKLKCERIYAGSFPCEERDGYIYVLMTNPEGRSSISGRVLPRGASTILPCLRRSCQNSASAIKSRISGRIYLAALIRLSSA